MAWLEEPRISTSLTAATTLLGPTQEVEIRNHQNNDENDAPKKGTDRSENPSEDEIVGLSPIGCTILFNEPLGNLNGFSESL